MTRHEHLPIVAGSWDDPTDLGDGTQRITCSGRCQGCRDVIYRVEYRSAPLDPGEWSVGEDLLSAGPWGTSTEHQQWRDAVDRMHARHEADQAAWQEVGARLDDAQDDDQNATKVVDVRRDPDFREAATEDWEDALENEDLNRQYEFYDGPLRFSQYAERAKAERAAIELGIGVDEPLPYQDIVHAWTAQVVDDYDDEGDAL